MELTIEALLSYQGLNGTYGVCHARDYEQPGQLPVVLAGAVEDSPGTSLNSAIEMVAAAIQALLLPDGREFELIEYHPDSPHFMRVRFQHRHISENPSDPSHYAGKLVITNGTNAQIGHGPPIAGDFRDPQWEPIEDIEQLLGCPVEQWPVGEYTAHAVSGDAGQQLRDEAADRTGEAVEQIADAIEGDA